MKIWGISHGSGRATRYLKGLQLPVGKESEPPAVRRPDRPSPSLRSRQGPGSKRVKGTDPKHMFSARIHSRECYSGSIRTEHWRADSCDRGELELSFLRWQYVRDDGTRRGWNHPQVKNSADNGCNQKNDGQGTVQKFTPGLGSDGLRSCDRRGKRSTG